MMAVTVVVAYAAIPYISTEPQTSRCKTVDEDGADIDLGTAWELIKDAAGV